jgi:hypothetical protein
MSVGARPCRDSKAQPLIEALRQNVGPKAAELDDQSVGKFLKARNYDVNNAAAMLTKHLQWREENKVDKVLQEYFGATADRPDIHAMYNNAFYGLDKESNPVFVERAGKAKVSEIFSKFDTDFLQRWHIGCMETGQQLYKKSGGNGILIIWDAEGVGMSHCSTAMINFLRATIAIDQDNYPEHLVRCIVINAGTVFKYGWKLMSPFIDANTKTKVVVYGSDYKQVLQDLVQQDQLPAYLGGSFPESHCVRAIGAPVPGETR